MKNTSTSYFVLHTMLILLNSTTLCQTRKKKMALFLINPSFIFLTLALFFSLCFLSLPHANAITTSPEIEFSTSVLDVTTALNQAHQVLSFTHQEEIHAIPSSSSSSLSFQLHPRDSVFNSQHKDYKSLVLARLGRDSARVNWIISKLKNSLNRNNSDSYPDNPELRSELLSAKLTSGVSQGSGEYFTRIGVGQPPQSIYMVIDTGSDLIWIQCRPCLHCYKQSDPVFNPSASTSYAPVPCDAKQCVMLENSTCTANDECIYQVVYGDGSYTYWNLMYESLTLGIIIGEVYQVIMGCGHVNQGLFIGAAGILGLGGGNLSFTSMIKASSFSYCMVHRDSRESSTLDFNSPPFRDSVTTRLIKNPKISTFYYVEFTGVSIGGKRVSVPPSTFKIDESGNGGIFVDSGTAITRFPIEAYNSVRDAFVSMTRHLRRAQGIAILDTCYDLSSVKIVRVPTVSFEMSDGKSWQLPVVGYMIPVDNRGTFCFAFAPSPAPVSIIGNVQQQGTRVTFDLENSLVGFSPGKC